MTPLAVTLMATNGTQFYLFEAFLVIAMSAYAVWIVQYTITARWWENMLGRHQVVASGFVEFFLLMLFIFTVVPSWQEVTAWILVASAGLLAFMMCWRITIWARLEHAARLAAEQKPPPDPPDDTMRG